MSKWSKQAFLNPADSNDDGWYKFSVRPSKHLKSIGLSIQYIISDCSNKIYLEFGPDSIAIESDGGAKDISYAQDALKDITDRRKKIKAWGAAVAKSVEMIEKNLNDYEVEVLHALDIAQSRE
jgi:hypothetical protein